MSVADPSTWSQYGKIDPEFEATLKAMPPLPSFSDSPDVPTCRAMINGLMAPLFAGTDLSGVKRSKIEIPVRDGTKIPALLYQSETEKNGPLTVLYHGGGFCIGVPEMEEPLALELVRKHGAVVVSVDYRMAPEKVFPVAIEDSYDALAWAAANASSIGADPAKGFLIGGSSAGGAISAVISHIARDEKLSPPLTGVWLNIPFVIGQTALPEKYKDIHKSYEQNRDAPILGVKDIDFFYKYYQPKDQDPRHSSLIWPGGHKNLPPHFIQCCGLDPLRDDALLYHRELLEQGVKSNIIVYPGVSHGFESVFGHISLGKKCLQERTEGFNALLGK